MGDVALHFLPKLGIQLALQLVERHIHQLAVQQINHFLHLGQRNLRRDTYGLILYLAGTGNNDRHSGAVIQRQQLEMAQ
ncbi:hypothetical protein D3C85_1527860 [compost metagenome]